MTLIGYGWECRQALLELEQVGMDFFVVVQALAIDLFELGGQPL